MANEFGPTSRYARTETTQLELPDGEQRTYLRRRFLPPPERFALLGTVTIVAGDRIDNLAAAHIGDPELFWRLADANRAMQAEDLVVIGRVLRITLPDGIPGPADA
jgi:hypothetical protein